MRGLFRIFLTFAFIGLAALAAWPHLPTLRQEAAHFYAAWQTIRSAAPQTTPTPTPTTNTAAAQAAQSSPNAPRRRPIIVPSARETPSETNPDPFLQEARRRAELDPEAAMDWIQAHASGAERLRGILEVVALWAADDSENALLWLESNAQGVARLETLNSGMELWAQQDPIAAASWIDGMANDGSKLAAVKALAANWGTRQPIEASNWVAQLPAGPIRDAAGSALIESWTTVDAESAAIWALSEAEFNGHSDLLHLSIEKFVDTAPEQAEQFLRKLTDAYEAPEVIETYILARAKNNPREAMNWLTGLRPEDPLNQPDNSRIIMQEWSRTDSVAASAWLNETAPGSKRDTAIIGFTRTMLDFEPEAATAWANSISAPQTRMEYLRQSIEVWARTQPAEARAWLQSADLTPEFARNLAAKIEEN